MRAHKWGGGGCRARVQGVSRPIGGEWAGAGGDSGGRVLPLGGVAWSAHGWERERERKGDTRKHKKNGKNKRRDEMHL